MSWGVEGVLMAEVALETADDPLDGIIRRVRQGETEAFAELVALTEKQVLGAAWRILRDRELARDAAQEAYLRIFRGLGQFRLGEAFRPWMYRVTVNACTDLLRRRGPLPAGSVDLEGLAGEGPHPAEEAVLLAQRRGLIRQGLDRLTQAERIALVLRDLEGLSTEEVARALGVRPVTVRSQVASARAKLRTFCERWLGSPQGGAP